MLNALSPLKLLTPRPAAFGCSRYPTKLVFEEELMLRKSMIPGARAGRPLPVASAQAATFSRLA